MNQRLNKIGDGQSAWQIYLSKIYSVFLYIPVLWCVKKDIKGQQQGQMTLNFCDKIHADSRADMNVLLN